MEDEKVKEVYNVLNHQMVPGHEFVNLEDEEEVLEELGVEREQLPKIKVKDPAIEALRDDSREEDAKREKDLDKLEAYCLGKVSNSKSSSEVSEKLELKKEHFRILFSKKEKRVEFETKLENGGLKENDYKEILMAIDKAKLKYQTSKGRIVRIHRKESTAKYFIVYRLVIGELKE